MANIFKEACYGHLPPSPSKKGAVQRPKMKIYIEELTALS